MGAGVDFIVGVVSGVTGVGAGVGVSRVGAGFGIGGRVGAARAD